MRSGLVFPSLDQVGQDPRDNAADRAASKSRTKAQAEAKKASTRKRSRREDNGLDDDVCRHACLTHQLFTPGVVSYLCSCDVLLGFEVLEGAVSPAGIIATLTARFPCLRITI